MLVKRTSNTAVLSWASGTRPDLKLYEIELKSERRGLTEVIRTPGLTNSHKLEDLHPGTTYKYKIRAVANNENEKGPWSETLEFTTAGMFPSNISIMKYNSIHFFSNCLHPHLIFIMKLT